jgi:hypothetical protein
MLDYLRFTILDLRADFKWEAGGVGRHAGLIRGVIASKRRETVKTIGASAAEANPTALKRGVNERRPAKSESALGGGVLLGFDSEIPVHFPHIPAYSRIFPPSMGKKILQTWGRDDRGGRQEPGCVRLRSLRLAWGQTRVPQAPGAGARQGRNMSPVTGLERFRLRLSYKDSAPTVLIGTRRVRRPALRVMRNESAMVGGGYRAGRRVLGFVRLRSLEEGGAADLAFAGRSRGA